MSTTPPPNPAPAAKSGSGCMKIFIIVMVILVIIMIGVGVGAYWVFQKAKQKAEELKAQVNQQMGQIQSGQMPNMPNLPGGMNVDIHPADPCATSSAAALQMDKATIPMVPGMTMMKVWTTDKGDLETLTQVQSVDDASVNVTASGPDRNNPSQRVNGKRNICVADLQGGNMYMTVWGGGNSELVHGATMFSLSQAEYQALKNNQPVQFTYVGSAKPVPNGYLLSDKDEGTLTRVEPDAVPFSVVVNEDVKNVPTIHAKGTLGGHPVEIFAVDDQRNPIVLSYQMPDIKFGIKIMKITFPESKGIEKQLETQGKAIIYGIYFDFNSATIRPESEPVLKEIAQVMTDHPDWKLAVNGHTDNVGGNVYNQKLSVKRAESVKQALVTEYNIGEDRFTTAGYGAGSPVDTNETPEGRAKNRRVELIKQ